MIRSFLSWSSRSPWAKAPLSAGGAVAPLHCDGTVTPIIETSPPRLTISQNLLLLSTILTCMGFHVQSGFTTPLIDLARREAKDWSSQLRDEEEFWDQTACILTCQRTFLLPVTIRELSSQLSLLICRLTSVSVPTSGSHRPLISERPFTWAENLLLICWWVGVIPSYTKPPSSGEPFRLREFLTDALRDAGIEFAEVIEILNRSPLFGAEDRLSIRRAEASLDILEGVLQPMAPDLSVRNPTRCWPLCCNTD